jgi:hypothetical protein
MSEQAAIEQEKDAIVEVGRSIEEVHIKYSKKVHDIGRCSELTLACPHCSAIAK